MMIRRAKQQNTPTRLKSAALALALFMAGTSLSQAAFAQVCCHTARCPECPAGQYTIEDVYRIVQDPANCSAYTATNPNAVLQSRQQVAMALCTAAPNCPSQSVTWTVGGNTCNGTVGDTNDGETANASNVTAGVSGAANFECSNGSFTFMSGTCDAIPTGGCDATTLTWVKDGYTCTSTTTVAADGAEQTITDATGPATGSNTYVCQGTNFVQKMGATVTCTASAPPPPPPVCSPPSPPVTDFCLHTVTSQMDEGCLIDNCSTTLYRIAPVTDLANFSYWQSTGGTVCPGTCNGRTITGRTPSDISNLQPCSPPPPC